MCNLNKDNPFFQDLYLDISIFMNVCNITIYISEQINTPNNQMKYFEKIRKQINIPNDRIKYE